MEDRGQRARAVLGYDEVWDRAGVIDEALLDAQSRALETDAQVHREHYRWAMWRAYVVAAAARPLDDATLEALLALDSHEASRAGPGFGHGLSSRTQASFLRKLAAPRRRR